MAQMTMAQFKSKLNAWVKNFPSGVFRGVKVATKRLRREVGMNLTGGMLSLRTGDLLLALDDDIRKYPEIVGAVTIDNKQKYKAMAHIEGMRITPKRKRVMKFKIDRGGRNIYTKEVKLPKKDFMRKSFRAVAPFVPKIILGVIMKGYK